MTINLVNPKKNPRNDKFGRKILLELNTIIEPIKKKFLSQIAIFLLTVKYDFHQFDRLNVFFKNI